MPGQLTRTDGEREAAWPAWVYGTGSEPDYRFSFANERTFLAWIRTAMALVAGGVALDALDRDADGTLRTALPAVLLLLGGLCAGLGWVRWAGAERAVRRRKPLPSSMLSAVVAVGVLTVALVAVAALLL